MTRTTNGHQAVAERLNDVDKIQQVLKQAAQQAILEHQRAGRKIVVWRDNRVVWEDPASPKGE